MKLETFQYISKNGQYAWTIEKFPDLDSNNTLVLIFSAPEYIKNPGPLMELSKHYPKSQIIGCSSAGEIAGICINDHSLSVAVIKFEKTMIKTSLVNVNNVEKSFEAGKSLAKIMYRNDLRGIFVLSDGLKINGSELVKGLNTVVRKDIVITGGLAADGSDFKKTWTFLNGKIASEQIVAVGFYGDQINIGHSSRGGWDIFGPERLITRSNHNILYELDGKPALMLYKEYLGDKAAGLPATGLLFPLAIRESSSNDKKLVRTILSVDESTNSLIFAGDMPLGYQAQLMRANFDRIIEAASQAAKFVAVMAQEKNDKKSPVLVIAISCVGRRLLLGERTEEETESTLEAFPENTQQVGFYSYGELSPIHGSSCDLHNQTMTLTSFSEGD